MFEQTTIPVPRVRRIVRDEYDKYIIMDYIPGKQLCKVWPAMETWEKLRVVFTLRNYVRQLQAIRHPRSSVPDPMATDGARVCTLPLFGPIAEFRGPFPSYPELSAFFNERHRLALIHAHHLDPKTAQETCCSDPFDDSQPLVLTHNDINMRNILVGDDGRLWLIDWAWAGFWPPWFEYLATKIQGEHESELLQRNDLLRKLQCCSFLSKMQHCCFLIKLKPCCFLHKLQSCSFLLTPNYCSLRSKLR